MFIVLSNRQRDKPMPDTQNTEMTTPVPEETQQNDERAQRPSRVAAAIEAAYILEAVRK